MLKRLAKCSALPGVGEETATSSASCGMIWREVAWMSAWNWEPMMPIFTLPVVSMEILNSGIKKEKTARGNSFDLADMGRRSPAPLHNLAGAWLLGSWIVAADEFLE